MIRTDTDQAIRVGKVISQIGTNQEYKQLSDDDLEYERMLLFVKTAIHHQINFHFLDKALRSIPKDRFNTAGLKETSAEEMQELLKGYHKPDRILADGRAALVRDFCSVLGARFDGSIRTLLERSGNSVVKLRKNLNLFKAYSEDPLRKKSNVLIQFLSRTKLVEFVDIEKVDPAMDYHLVRLALRNGMVRVEDKMLDRKLVSQEAVTEEEDTLIREKTIEAFRVTAESGRKTIPELNWIEWHIARSFCLRDSPVCSCDDNPLADDLEFEFSGKCPLFDSCERKLEYKREPLFKTSFY